MQIHFSALFPDYMPSAVHILYANSCLKICFFSLFLCHLQCTFSMQIYGVYISQLIRYVQCCSHYDDFRYRHKRLVDGLLSQGYIALRLEKSSKKFYGKYQDLTEKYQRSVNVMVNNSLPG